MSSIDVIVPCYRYAHFLRQCVESALATATANVRVLVIDDASPDNTSEVAQELVREDTRVSFLRHSKNKGHIATYNEGIDWISSDYWVLLSADDFLLPGALDRAVTVMEPHPEIGFIFGKAIELIESDPASSSIPTTANDRWDFTIQNGIDFIRRNKAANEVHCPTAVVRTALQKRLGGYLPSLPYSGDMEMWLRLAAHSAVGILDSYQAVYRIHGTNMSNGYVRDYGLGDLRQRKAALDCFFETCRDRLPDAKTIQEKLYGLLGSEAMGRSSFAFNQGQAAICEQLSQVALETYPAVKGSWRWTRLAWKRRIGFRAWRMVSSVLAPLRGAIGRSKSMDNNRSSEGS